MMALDLSGRTDDEVQIAYNTLVRNPERFADNPEYAAAVQAEYGRRFRRPRQAVPDNVDAKLEAAAAPIEADPSVKPRGWQDMTDEEMVANLPPDAGPGGGVGVRHKDLPAYGARYRQAVARTIDRGVAQRQAARAQGYQDPEQVAYNRATGLSPAEAGGAPPARRSVPSNVDRTYYDQVDGGRGTTPYEIIDGVMVPASVNSIDQTQWTLGDEKRAKEARQQAFRDAGGEYAFPGPRNDDGSPVERRRFSSPKEASEYYTRPTNPETGQIMPSQYDLDRLNSAGEAAAYDAEGNIVYLPASPNNSQIYGPMSPSARRRQGAKIGIDPGVPFDRGGDGMYEEAERQGPLGPVRVLVPTQATREKWDADKGARLRARLIENAGISTADAEGLSDDQLRAMARDSRASDLRDRRAAVVRRGIARGNPLEYLGRDDVNDWQRMVMAEQFLRQAQTMTPLGVDAVGGANAMRMMNADIFAQGMPGAIQAAEARRKADRMDRLRVAAAKGAEGTMIHAGGREGAERMLKREGATREERTEILDDMFGPEGAAPAVPSARPDTLHGGAGL